jgi:hypothetical protein
VFKARGPAERGIVAIDVCTRTAIGRFAGFANFGLTILGFRCAPPQALCHRPLRGLIPSRVREVSTPGNLIDVVGVYLALPDREQVGNDRN